MKTVFWQVLLFDDTGDFGSRRVHLVYFSRVVVKIELL
jgi:hypothetical protein